MIVSTPLEEQIAEAAGDRLRVLVVGAGVAGIMLCQLLRRHGLHPVLVEHAAPGTDPGYMLALMPMVDPVIEQLGVGQRYRERSTAAPVPRPRAHRARASRGLDGRSPRAVRRLPRDQPR
ncbi:FAD-dependent monooxygenase [Pseudonocardia asaccharolytica]|uniref:FAD-binding domain-containing protein n=1 Tax=Pseudonocardia asaccharolytica DSM 44247 = NBRC 16224 TaxID=1123024 RepID=A0A511D6I7_9PSEU|nr:FAD-dependent monooxygenase [Pseudonocardia asaccharolytica]GEL19224.1 hypothetical protein PA7_30610 [Pseudonocardia asaccharolytica DSM 44247 = NBRC 16224]